MVGHMGVLKMKSVSFQATEQGVNLPACPIVIKRGIRGGIGDQNQILVSETDADDRDAAAPDATRREEKTCLAERRISEKSRGRLFPRASAPRHGGIVANTEAKGDVVFA